MTEPVSEFKSKSGMKRILPAMSYAIAGLKAAWKHEHAFRQEMVMVIVITGVLGSMAAVFIKMPVQQYMDVARRADLTDIMDLALSRMENDIRSALPYSARASSVACTGGCRGKLKWRKTYRWRRGGGNS